MGYTTKFKGVLKFPKGVTVDQLAYLNQFLGEWADGYIQFEVAKDMSGIQWDGSEKFYKTVECVNYLTGKMREKWPKWKFFGELQAQGDDIEDRWKLVMKDGVAIRVDDPVVSKIVTCPHCHRRFELEGFEGGAE